MRLTRACLAAFIFALCAGAALYAAEPPLNPEKYPQDTPQKALSSLVKSLDNKDYAYWIGHLMTPVDKKTLLDKHGTLEKAAEFLGDEKFAAKMKERKELMEKMLEANKTTEGDDNGVKWVRFHMDTRELQLEKQPDGRWCMNARFNGSGVKKP